MSRLLIYSLKTLPWEVINLIGKWVFETGDASGLNALKRVSRLIGSLTTDSAYKVTVFQVGKQMTKEEEELEWGQILGSKRCWWIE